MRDKLTTYLMAAVYIVTTDPAPMPERLWWLAAFLAAVEAAYWAMSWYRRQIPFKALPPTPLPPTPLPPVRPQPLYWIGSSGKRHASSCRFFETGSGAWGSAGDGTACRVCGG